MNERFADFIDRLNKEMGTDENFDEWLDNGDVCRLLNVSKRTLQTYRDTGKLPFSQINHKVFYKQKDVETFLNERKSKWLKDAFWVEELLAKDLKTLEQQWFEVSSNVVWMWDWMMWSSVVWIKLIASDNDKLSELIAISKDFEKELGYVKNFKVNNIITENNIVKSFNVEKCEWNLKDLKTVFCMA